MVSDNLDSLAQREWKSKAGISDLPTFDDMVNCCLECQVLENRTKQAHIVTSKQSRKQTSTN